MHVGFAGEYPAQGLIRYGRVPRFAGHGDLALAIAMHAGAWRLPLGDRSVFVAPDGILPVVAFFGFGAHVFFVDFDAQAGAGGDFVDISTLDNVIY